MNEALGVATVLCLRSPGWRPCHRRFCAGSGVWLVGLRGSRAGRSVCAL